MKVSLDKRLGLIRNIIWIVIALWLVVTAIVENVSLDSMLARFAVGLACISDLFSKHQKVRVLLFIIAFVLIAIATFIYIRK